ncbi:hypothetical protein [Aureimonas psammosilenae]|uniref:hypothetical protein n=1 Tax=Aureimonas psammosilenae TaxID=2495496 RepID=UPI001260E8E4|nr:hypothetical protein [Aureimonas psammosilenae]
MPLRPLILSLSVVVSTAAGALAVEDAVPAAFDGGSPKAAAIGARRLAAAADCAGAAAEAAARTGGRVLSVSSRSDGGRVVCVVTLLVPADQGGRPRKQTVVIPQ